VASGLHNFVHTFFDWSQLKAVLPSLLKVGLLNTIELSIGAIVLGVLVGMVLAVALLSSRVWVRFPARAYVDVFRGLPIILTILLVGEGLPIAGLHPFGRSAYPYAMLALGIVAGAYIAEIFRSGIQSVDRGQLEAARCLGMSHFLAMALVVIPQGVRRILPALANQFVAMVKDSSLVYLLGLVVGQRELFSIAQDQTAASGSLAPLVAAGLFYIAITVPMTHLVNHLDRRLREGPSDRGAPQSLVLEAGEGR
jgi:His/Glu/Gln/Arg/opine family amino acid ABC transporter permease subunit